MKLLCTLITYNRLAYSKRTLDSFRRTVDVPYYLNIVDNASTDGTVEWLKQSGETVLLNDENMYPGRATNRGWANGTLNYPEATHFMRLDNDMEFSPGWASRAVEYFQAFDNLGQLGLDYTALETYNGNPDYLTIGYGKTINLWPGNVGGPCIIPREVYDKGVRYDESPWQHDGGSRPTAQEDAKLSMVLLTMGYKVGHATEKLAWTFADKDSWGEYPDYYQKTMQERGYKWLE